MLISRKGYFIMKKIFALILVLALSLTCVAAFAEDKPTLTMATNAAFPPYEYHEMIDGEDKIVGIDAEIFYAICDYLGYEGVIDDIDFNAIIPALQGGKADLGMAGMTVTEDRLQSVDFTDSYATGIQSVIVAEDSDITSVDDLFAEGANHKIGVQLGTTGDIYCSDDIQAEGLGEVVPYATGTDAVLALTTGKVDCVVIDNEPAKAFVAANEGLKILDTEYAVEDYAIALAKGSELTAKINDALAELKADGTLDAIVAKYIPAAD